MRKNYTRRIAVDQRKKITTGYKGKHTTKAGKEIEIPKKADHFVLSHPETKEVFFPELVEFYGESPKEMFIMFPSDDYTEFFDDNFNLWTSTHNKRRSCDGETCTHIIEETVKGQKFGAGEVTECICELFKLKEAEDKETKNLACGCDMYLKAYILNPSNSKIISPSCYMFYSGSINTADNLRSQLERFKRLSGIPFKLFLKEITRNNNTFVIWDIIPYIKPQDLIKYQYSNVALTDGMNLLETGETVHTEKKAPYEYAAIADVKTEDASFEVIDEKQWTIKEFEEGFLNGSIEGEEVLKVVTNIFKTSPKKETLIARAESLAKIKGFNEETRKKMNIIYTNIKTEKGF